MILLVDDDSSITVSLTLALKQAGFKTRSASSPAEALQQLEGSAYTLVIQDMNFSRKTSGEEGLALLQSIKTQYPELPVILITAWGSIQLAVAGMKAGASDFITKPWSRDGLLQSVRTALGLARLRTKRPALPTPTRAELNTTYDFRGIVGSHPKLLQVLDLVGRVAATDASVLITGESGTGKELIAEAIHRNSPRRHQAFVKVNLGGISSALFESEMFGHVRGAFTDAVHDRQGRFALAHQGSIFLDEIGDLDASSQVKLLRVLQDRTYEVLGSSQTRHVDTRIISATNRALPMMVEQGAFREDLLYRINLINIHLPPLRERPDDIPLIAEHVLRHARDAYGRPGIQISDSAFAWLQAQPWPGNIRQLKHLIERAVLVTPRRVLEAEDFGASTSPKATAPSSLPAVGSMTLDEVEKAIIEQTLAHHKGNITHVAEALGLSRAALYRRFKKYGIDM